MHSSITPAPTRAAERIQALDTIRGIAVLGILLMNITAFGLYHSYDDPTVNGSATGWNLKVWWMNVLFFEGTMRGMFSMLFGAGILLFTSRSIDGDSGRITDLFFRRLSWMVLFGIIHCYLLMWNGEILYCYGIVGMFAFSFRHLQPRKLITGTLLILSVITLLNVKDHYDTEQAFTESEAAIQKKNAGNSISKEETAAIEKWEGIAKERKPGEEKVAEEIAARHKGYFSILKHLGPENQFMQTVFLYRYNFFDTLAMMLLGMAMFKLGILQAARSRKWYLLMVLVGYGVGISVNYYEGHLISSQQFSILALSRSYLTYDVGRLATTCGHIGLIMLFIQSGWLGWLRKSLAATGQMAFTNYIMQTIICNLIFLGFGFSLYGKLQRYELYYVVAGIWVLQMILSPLWLKYFRFGPLEWAWRCLTYWKRQPFRKTGD